MVQELWPELVVTVLMVAILIITLIVTRGVSVSKQDRQLSPGTIVALVFLVLFGLYLLFVGTRADAREDNFLTAMGIELLGAAATTYVFAYSVDYSNRRNERRRREQQQEWHDFLNERITALTEAQILQHEAHTHQYEALTAIIRALSGEAGQQPSDDGEP